jgi:hypothetical protein
MIFGWNSSGLDTCVNGEGSMLMTEAGTESMGSG